MNRWKGWIAALVAGVLTGCTGSSTTTTPGAQATPDTKSTVAVTSNVPTARPAGETTFPVGTLILTQSGRPLAQLPNLQVVSIPEERFSQGSPDRRYAVRFRAENNAFVLELLDYSTEPPTVKTIPDSSGLRGPGIKWRRDASAVAFSDFPPPGQTSTFSRNIYYYEIASGQTKKLLPDVQDKTQIPSPVGFSPDGKYLLYVVSKADAEGTGGPDSQAFILDMTTNQSTALPQGSLFGFSQWLNDSSGFITLRTDTNGLSGVYNYALNALNTPKRLTPANTNDFLVDLSPDGKRISVTSTPAQDASVANIFMMNLDGSNRKTLTNFADPEQTITALVWGTDGIYYSLSGADNEVTTWRMDLDGTNVTQLAKGNLEAVVGAG